MSGDQHADECIVKVFYAHDKDLTLKAGREHGASITVGELVTWVKASCQQIPAEAEFNAYPWTSNQLLSYEEDIPADLHLRLIAKGLEREHTRLYETEGKTVSAIPLPAFIRQEAKNFSILENLLELIDNAISATWRKNRAERYEPKVSVKLKEAEDPAMTELIVEDNGTGIEREVLERILVSAFSFSAGPPILARSHLPLPLERYINQHFNRYGRGLNALFFFGDLVSIESKVPGAVQGNKLVADYKEWQEANSRKDIQQYQCKISAVHVISTGRPGSNSGETSVRISRLRPEILSMLRSTEVQQWLQKQTAAVYHLHLHGMDKALFDRLPGCLRQSSARPKPTVTMNVLGVQMGKKAGGEIPFNESKPPILKMAESTRALYAKHPFIKPFVLCARYEPKELQGKAPTGEGLELDEEERKRLAASQASDVLSIDEDDEDPVAQQQKATEQHWKEVCRKAAAREPPGTRPSTTASTPGPGGRGSVRGGRGRGASTPHMTPKGTPAAGGRSSGRGGRGVSSSGRGSWSDGGSSSSQRGAGAPEGPEARQALREEREQQEEHRGPLGVIDHEQERKPAFVDFACIFDYSVHEELKQKLGAISIWSGRVLPGEHSRNAVLPDFVAAAKELCRINGVSFYDRLDAERIGGLLLISPECQAAIHKNRATDPAYDVFMHLGSSLISDDEDKMPDLLRSGNFYTFNQFTNCFELDNSGELAARMLMHHFVENWTPLDDVGKLVYPTISCEEKETVWITHSKAWKPPASMRDAIRGGRELDAICAGEMVRVVVNPKETGTDDVRIGAGDTHAAPCNFFIVEEFMQVGSDQPLARVKQWRPSWCDPDDPAIQRDNLPVLRIRPLAPSTAERAKDAAGLAKKFEGDAPHHLAFRKGKSGNSIVGTVNPQEVASLAAVEDCTYTATHNFNEVHLLIVSQSNKAAKDPKSRFKDIRLSKSGKALTTFQPTVTATLTNDKGKKVWEQAFDAADGVNVCVEGFHASIKREGDYELLMIARDKLGVMSKQAPPLRYCFAVVSAQEPPRIEAAWCDSPEECPRAVAGETLPPLKLAHMRGSRLLPMPHAPDWSVLKDCLHVTLQLHGMPSSNSGSGRSEQAEEEEEGTSEQQPSKRRRKTKNPSSLRLTRAEIVPQQDGSIVLQKVEVPHAVLSSSPEGYKVAHQDFQLFVSMQPPAAGGSTAAGQLTAPPLMLSVVSGLPAEIRGTMGKCEQGVSKGYFVPEMVVALTDKHGAPWFNAAAATKKGPKKPLKGKGKGQASQVYGRGGQAGSWFSSSSPCTEGEQQSACPIRWVRLARR